MTRAVTGFALHRVPQMLERRINDLPFLLHRLGQLIGLRIGQQFVHRLLDTGNAIEVRTIQFHEGPSTGTELGNPCMFATVLPSIRLRMAYGST